jgi:hypothetical protein
MKIIINSNTSEILPYISQVRRLPAQEVIGPFDPEIKTDPRFKTDRDRGLVTIISNEKPKEEPEVETPEIKEATKEDLEKFGVDVGDNDTTVKSTVHVDENGTTSIQTQKSVTITQSGPAFSESNNNDEKLNELVGQTISKIKLEVMSGNYDIPRLIALEEAGKNRKSLISFLQQL